MRMHHHRGGLLLGRQPYRLRDLHHTRAMGRHLLLLGKTYYLLDDVQARGQARARVVGSSRRSRRTPGAASSRQWCSWDVPGQTVQPMSCKRTAGGVPAGCFGGDHACAGCSNRRCRGTLTASMATALATRRVNGAQSGRQVWSSAFVVQGRGPCNREGIPSAHTIMFDSEMLPRRATHAAGVAL